MSLSLSRPKVVILGCGWAGFTVLKGLSKKYDVHLISPRNHFLFTPLLASSTVGTLEFRCVAEPVRTARSDLQYIQASCQTVDPTTKTLSCVDFFSGQQFSYRYDKLVIATGATTATWGVPGVREFAFTLSSLADARAIRNRIIECFERASNPFISASERARLLHFVICGGGPTSIEFAAELYDFVKADVSVWFPDLAPMVHLTVVEASNVVLGSFKSSLQNHAMRLFKRRNIEVLTGARVTEIFKDRVAVTIEGNSKEIEFGLCMWSAGIGPSQFVKDLPFAKKENDWRIVVDNYLAVPGHSDVFVVGDISATGLPATAQAAVQEAQALVRNLNATIDGGASKPFAYSHFFTLAYIGRYRALLDTGPQKPGSVRATLSGFAAFVVWRAAYFTMLLSWQNKMLVPMYWFKSFMFGRDITRF